jgi:UDP-N-acetylglucosamine diphosphorylase/glucosamine-1-phosphate N-acetyltransferase
MWLILEEEHVENFWPLSRTRATWELRFGAWCPLERALLETPSVAVRVRPELAAYARAKTGLPVNEDIEARGITGRRFSGLPYATPWEILSHSGDLIAQDYPLWRERNADFKSAAVLPGAHIVGDPRDLHVGEGALVQPGCVLDVSGGPIIIGPGSQVKFSQIQGPVFIGPNCTLDGARVRPGTSLGHGCKIGGEISASIFQSRANKGHEGFVGHTWAGRWVNFGALATTSNLKNTYGSIRFPKDGATDVDTGAQFLGSLIGDHTKIGIGQMLNTGSHIGVGCNVFGGGVAPKYIPSFSWGGLAGWQQYRLDDCLKTVRATLARRKATLRPESEHVLRDLFESTRADRASLLAP